MVQPSTEQFTTNRTTNVAFSKWEIKSRLSFGAQKEAAVECAVSPALVSAVVGRTARHLAVERALASRMTPRTSRFTAFGPVPSRRMRDERVA